MQFRKATRQKAKIRLGLSGPSGAGKTVSALRIAYGLTRDWNKIGLIDTENKSADLYANHSLPDGFTIGEFGVLTLLPPFSPERFIEAMNAAYEAGFEVLIIDSATHEWDGKGGCLEINERLASSKFKGNTWAAWSETTPRHQAFLNAITGAPIHVITTLRSKTDTIQTEDKKVKKIGLKEIQREGYEYELTVNFTLDRDGHYAVASKDRTGLFIKQDPFLITEDTGITILEWAESGEDVNTQVADAIRKLDVCTTTDEVIMLGENLPALISEHPDFRAAGNARFATLRDEARQVAQAAASANEPTQEETEKEPSTEAVSPETTSEAATEIPPVAEAPNDPEKMIESFKERIGNAATPDELTDLLGEVNKLPDEQCKHLRRTVNAKARQSGWISNKETKRFELSAAEETTPVPTETKPAEAPAPPVSKNDEATLLGIINGATDMDHLRSIALASNIKIEASETLTAAFKAKQEELMPLEQSVAAKPVVPTLGAEVKAAPQTREWFKARIGSHVWMQGDPSNPEHWTGAYLIENDSYPDYMVDTLQSSDGYLFRELTPEEYEAAAAQEANAA